MFIFEKEIHHNNMKTGEKLRKMAKLCKIKVYFLWLKRYNMLKKLKI